VLQQQGGEGCEYLQKGTVFFLFARAPVLGLCFFVSVNVFELVRLGLPDVFELVTGCVCRFSSRAR